MKSDKDFLSKCVNTSTSEKESLEQAVLEYFVPEYDLYGVLVTFWWICSSFTLAVLADCLCACSKQSLEHVLVQHAGVIPMLVSVDSG